MGITSLQVCMDSSDWLQGTISEEAATGIMDSSSPLTPPLSGSTDQDIDLTCSRPLLERRLMRPQHEQALKCPRCESTHTKFCYYNNYSLSQPRYFCKTCRRYWTKGGTLRNIPVGGGCRKNKKVSSSNSKNNNKPSSSSSSLTDHNQHHHNQSSTSSPSSPSPLILNHFMQNHTPLSYNNPTDLHLAFTDQLQFSSSLHAAAGLFNNAANSANFLLDINPTNNNNSTPIDFMDNKYDNNNFMLNNAENFGGIMATTTQNTANFHGINGSSFGQFSSSLDQYPGNNSTNILESCQRLMLPYENLNQNHYHHDAVDDDDDDVKPNSKVLSLEWHDHHHQQAAGYNFGGLGSWSGLMNGYGSSATNPLV